MKYSSKISWIIFVLFIIALGLVLGLKFGVDTWARTVLALILLCIWTLVDFLLRKHTEDR